MTGDPDNSFDRELQDLPAELRWREWMRRIEAVLFASAAPVPREELARVVGQGASVDLLVEDLRADLADRPYEIHKIGAGWALRTRPTYAAMIRAAADPGPGEAPLRPVDMAVLAAIAWHQPITRAEIAALFGGRLNREILERLRGRDLIAFGPRSPQRGAPRSFVTTEGFLELFGLDTLQDLPELPAPTAAPPLGVDVPWSASDDDHT